MKKYASLLLLILTGCSSLQMTTSIPEEELKENQFSQYDPETKIQYMISNDRDNLHLKFKTSEQSSIRKILQGTTVYFDTQGKKKKKIHLEYPVAQEGRAMRPDQSQMHGQRTRPDQSEMQGMRSNQNQIQEERTRPDMGKMIEKLPMEAIFTNNDESEFIQFSLIETDIKPSLRKSGESEITYELIIPFHRLAEGGLASIDNLSVGIVTESSDNQSQGGNAGGGMGGPGGGMSGGMGGRGGGMGGPGGGMGGPGGGMGGSGGGMGGSGGGRPGGSGQNDMTSDIDIWFKVDLHR